MKQYKWKLWLKYFLYFLIVLLLLCIQVQSLNPLTVFKIKIDLVCCAIVAIALLDNERAASMFGLLIGLFYDATSVFSVGFYAILFMVMGYLTGRLINEYVRRNFLSHIFLSAVFVFLINLLVWVLFYVFNNASNLGVAFLENVLLKALLSAPVYLIIYFVFKFLSNKLKVDD